MIRHDDFDRPSKDLTASSSNATPGIGVGLDFSRLGVTAAPQTSLGHGEADWSRQTFASERDAVYLPMQQQDLNMNQIPAFGLQQQQQQQRLPHQQHRHQHLPQQHNQHNLQHQGNHQQGQGALGGSLDSSLHTPFFARSDSSLKQQQSQTQNNSNTNGHMNSSMNVNTTNNQTNKNILEHFGQDTVTSVLNASLDESKDEKINSPIPSSDVSQSHGSVNSAPVNGASSFYSDAMTIQSLNNMSSASSALSLLTGNNSNNNSNTIFDNNMKKEHNIPSHNINNNMNNNQMAMNIPSTSNNNNNASNSENLNAMFFAFYIPSGQVCENEKTMMRDILFKVNIKINSLNDGLPKVRTVYSTYKWFSEIRKINDSLRFSSNIQLPNIQLPLQGGEGNLTETDISHMQTYLNSLAEVYLNKDNNSQYSIQILSAFDNEFHSLSDKIKILILEYSLLKTVIKNNMLESDLATTRNELYATKRGLNEVNSMVAMLRRDMEQMKSGASTAAASVMRQPDQGASTVFSSQPSSPVITTTSGMYYSKQTHVNVPPAPKTQENIGTPGVIIEFAEIEPSTLVSYADAILHDKGPLPVGEVGKMLQEATGNLQLSALLKEKHNGLKKFLEKYSDKFIMSNDHPFNPHVYLRRCFTLDEQRLIEDGCRVFLDEFKKSKKTRRGNKANQKTTAWQQIPNSQSINTFQQKHFP